MLRSHRVKNIVLIATHALIHLRKRLLMYLVADGAPIVRARVYVEWLVVAIVSNVRLHRIKGHLVGVRRTPTSQKIVLSHRIKNGGLIVNVVIHLNHN
jgi:hypothetical protein